MPRHALPNLFDSKIEMNLKTESSYESSSSGSSFDIPKEGCSKCRICKTSKGEELCEEHQGVVNEKLNSLMELCGGEFGSLIEIMLSVGVRENYMETSDLCVLIKKINQQWKIGSKSAATFNTTQALKQYCRQKYQENQDALTRKPPRNSASKAEFVSWAEENGIDLSSFRTRKYRKKKGTKKATVAPLGNLSSVSAPTIYEWNPLASPLSSPRIPATLPQTLRTAPAQESPSKVVYPTRLPDVVNPPTLSKPTILNYNSAPLSLPQALATAIDHELDLKTRQQRCSISNLIN
eukprot:TRINITY_DN997_c0_g2_i1.p1 TRINITY_DN997_c0_g2~~TRINITY_DN997_c0_g2_i1.p1  ORF type:complete len:305 (-),score=75.48 TRINITY_DN997_c0_g2_i1:55-933(-)